MMQYKNFVSSRAKSPTRSGVVAGWTSSVPRGPWTTAAAFIFTLGITAAVATPAAALGGTCSCPSDVTGDGTVDFVDVTTVLSDFGACTRECAACDSDINGDCNVGIVDLILVLSDWGACPGSQTDPGETLAGATDLGVLGDGPVGGCARLTAGDVDVFALEVAVERRISVLVDDRDGGARVQLVADVNGDGIYGAGDAYVSVDEPGAANITFEKDLTPGTYWIRLEEAHGPTTYTLAVTSAALPVTTPADPGGQLAGAIELGPVDDGPRTLSHAVGPYDARDIVAFDVIAPLELAADVIGLTDAIRCAVGADIDGSGAIIGNGAVASDEAMIYAAGVGDIGGTVDLVPGRYWLLLNRFSTLDGTGFTATLSATPLPISVPEDPGDTLATAADLGVAGGAPLFIDEVYGAYDRADVVRFTVDAARRVSLELSGRTDGGRFDVLADVDGDGMAEPSEELRTRSSAGIGTITETVDLGPGTWWVRVGPESAGSASRYRLTASPTPLEITPTSDPGPAVLSAWPMGILGGAALVEREIVGPYDRIDAYRVDVASASSVVVRCDERSDGVRLSLRRDDDGDGILEVTEILAIAVDDDGGAVELTADLSAGPVYVHIESATPQASTAYRLDVRAE
ncbi:MAG: hypothetical protein AB8G96_16555 [Phycisphaerales bacterium]